MSIDVQKLADLARLTIHSKEKESIANDLEAIIGFVDQVQSVNIPKTDQSLDMVNVFRDDTMTPIGAASSLVDAAPAHKDGFIQVPKVIE